MHVVRQLTTNNINVKKRVQVYSMQISQCLYELTLRPTANTHSYATYIHECAYIIIYAHSRLHQCMLPHLEPQGIYAAFEVGIPTEGQMRGLPSQESGQNGIRLSIPTHILQSMSVEV